MFFECSAKDSTNVETALLALAHQAVKVQDLNKPTPQKRVEKVS